MKSIANAGRIYCGSRYIPYLFMVLLSCLVSSRTYAQFAGGSGQMIVVQGHAGGVQAVMNNSTVLARGDLAVSDPHHIVVARRSPRQMQDELAWLEGKLAKLH